MDLLEALQHCDEWWTKIGDLTDGPHEWVDEQGNITRQELRPGTEGGVAIVTSYTPTSYITEWPQP